MELHGGNVDRDTDMMGPVGGSAAGLTDHPRADRHDEAGVLGDGHELRRRNDPLRRMPPAQQRLEGADAVLLEVKQRLVEEFELVALQR